MSPYQGSHLLKPLADRMGLPIDQVNFVAGQLMALLFAFIYRSNLSANKVPSMYRHTISTLVGVALGIFCFGQQIGHILVQALGCYLLMKFMPASLMHGAVFVYSMGYMSYLHISALITSYGSYIIDVSSAAMVTCQKLTSFGFSYHDGRYKKETQLQHDQKKYAIEKLPNLLVFFSYVLNFHGMLVGPLCFFNDYIKFVDGTDFPSTQEVGKAEEQKKPKPQGAVLNKLLTAFISLVGTMTLAKIFTIERNVDKAFIEDNSFLWRVGFLMLSAFLSRAKYYFAWKLAEGINNAAGFGFNGFDENGKQKWDLVTNVRILNLETSTSFKGIVDNWNIQTASWLKRICYERAPVARTLLTYTLSAMWHGFYPGYYLTFVSAAFVTLAARTVRRNIRPYVLSSTGLKIPYDLLTWFSAQLTLGYLVTAHVLLDLHRGFYFYTYSMYWFIHIILGVILVAFPHSPRAPPKSTPSKGSLDINVDQNTRSNNDQADGFVKVADLKTD